MRYETEDDRKNQSDIVARFAEAHGFTKIKSTPPDCPFDYICSKDSEPIRIISAVEIKGRSFKWGHFPNIVLSLSKVKELIKFITEFKEASAYFVVADIDGEIYECQISEGTYYITGSTRKDRGVVDAVVRIPIGEFRHIGRFNVRKTKNYVPGGEKRT